MALVVIASAIAACSPATGPAITYPPASAQPGTADTPAIDQALATLVTALGEQSLVLQDPQRPFRPAEGPALAGTPRVVRQVTLPDDPDEGYLVIYDLTEAPRAAAAGADQAAYLATGPGRVQTPIGTQHVIRQLGSTIILYSWIPGTSPDERMPRIADALQTRRDRDPRPELGGRGRPGRLGRGLADGSGASAAAQRRTGSRLTLSVWVRGKSSVGQTRQPATRWFGQRLPLAALTAASMRARTRPAPPPPDRCPGARPPRSGPVASRRRPCRAGPRCAGRSRRPPGYTLKPLGRTMMSLIRPMRTSRPSGSRWPMSPVRYQPSSVKAAAVSLRVVPVAGEEGRATELDLAVSGSSRRSIALRRAADRPEPVVVEAGARAGPGLGRPVALEDGDAEVLPGLLERGRQERAGRQEQPEAAAEPGMDAAEEDPTER